jgi:hypothetical protein
MRQDLLTLTIDDLIALSNRGLVKRAQQELQLPDLTAEMAEDDTGNVQVQWSDQVCCTLAAQTTLGQSQCSCLATSLCRHLLRSVLFYQLQSTAVSDGPKTIEQPPEAVADWNPGSMTDEVLQKHYPKTVLKKLRSQFDVGQVIGVACGPKPSVHLHSLSLSLRFLIPNDIRYTRCDCDEAAPCSHVPLAVWAFRQLPPNRTHGLISTESQPIAVPTALLDDLETHLSELADVGIAGMNQALRDRFVRLEQRCRSAGLVWIAELLLDLLQAYHYYQYHDAQFDAEQVIALIGELLIRSDAIRNHEQIKNLVPQLFIRGSVQDTTVALGSSRLVGLGCGATMRATGITLTAYLQDTDSGTVVSMPRYFANPEIDLAPKPLWQLAQYSVSKGMQLGAIAAGQVLIKGGKRTPSCQLILGRSPMSLNPQSYQWEKLRSPLRIDDFAELIDRLRELPPRELRPRRVAEQLQVLSVAEVLAAEFDFASQTVKATVADAAGNQAEMIHPYSYRSRFGVEAMLAQLQQPNTLKFLSAQVSLSRHGLVLAPIALVFQSGEARQILQPWIAPPQIGKEQNVAGDRELFMTTSTVKSPISTYLQELSAALQELWLIGLERADNRHLQQWQHLSQQGSEIGFCRLLQPINYLTQAIAQKFHTLHWNRQEAQQALAIITVLSQFS